MAQLVTQNIIYRTKMFN